MKILSQKNPTWANVKLGNSNSTIANYGCTITCLSMLSDWYGDWKSPDWIAKNLSFNNNGEIFWTSINGKMPFDFVYRYYKQDDKKIKEILDSKDNACLLRINYISRGKSFVHWVVALLYGKEGYRIADPLDGTTKWLKFKITGFTEVRRK